MARTAFVVSVLVALPAIAQPGPARAEPAPSPMKEPAAAQWVSQSIGTLALADYGDVFAGVQTDQSSNTVRVYVTDTERGDELVDAGTRRLSATATKGVRVEVRPAKYTRVKLEAARTDLWATAKQWAAAGVSLYSIGVESDGSGLSVWTNQASAATRLLGSSRSVLAANVAVTDVTFTKGSQVKSMSRHDDYAPYYGGALIFGQRVGDRHPRCTSAFGIRSNVSGLEYLVTAAHCFAPGEDVFDGGLDPARDLIGEVWLEDGRNDAAAILTDTAGGFYFDHDSSSGRFGRAAFSFTGDAVCHTGYSSNRICSILVLNNNIEWSDETGTIRRGAVGAQCVGCVTVRPGDSGGPVWVTGSDGSFESRGIVSAGSGGDGETWFEYVWWTETPAVLGAFNASLQTTWI